MATLKATTFTGNISYKGSNSTNTMIAFLNNTTDAYGNGIAIGGGGRVVIGAGESAGAFTDSTGDETLYLTSDTAVYVKTSNDNGSSYNTFTFGTTGTFSAPALSTTGRLHINYTSDVEKSSLSGSLIIGNSSGSHIAIDDNEIMAKASASTGSSLFLNAEGGDVYFSCNDGDTIKSYASGGYLYSGSSKVVTVTSSNRQGVYRLYRRDDNSNYSVQTDWTGSYWRLRGYDGDTYHAECQVGYSDSSNLSNQVYGIYTSNGGQQGPSYFGRNRVGFLMSNESVNGYTNYTNWMYMDNYSGDDVGGATAFGVARTEPRAFILQSDKNRSSWNNRAEFITTYNIANQSVNYANSSGYADSAGSASSASSAGDCSNAHSTENMHYYYKSKGPVTRSSAGWIRLGTLEPQNGYAYAELVISGNWYYQSATVTKIIITCMHTSINITQESGAIINRYTQIKAVQTNTDRYIIALYAIASPSGPDANDTFQIATTGSWSWYSDQTVYNDPGSATVSLSLSSSGTGRNCVVQSYSSGTLTLS